MTTKPEPNTRPLPQPSELVERLRADAVVYHASMYEPETDDMFTLAYQWQDKKHRHVNDLCGKLNEAADHITQLEAQIAKLQAVGDKLAGALERSRQGWSNVLELGLLPVQHQSTALGLQEAATQALAAKGDSRG
jgi:DNA repair ATPase RecN